jgi:AcrR family transcriptional regulator
MASDRADEIARAARAIVEEEGVDALTMRRLADRLGVKAPSLYKHVRNKAELEAAVIASGLDELAEAMSAAVRGTAEPVGALADAYRGFALAHPHVYRLMTERPLPRHLLPPGLEARAAAPLLSAVETLDRARALWAFAHGMCQLELTGRFPDDADLSAAWQDGVAAFATRQTPRRAVVRSWRGPD